MQAPAQALTGIALPAAPSCLLPCRDDARPSNITVPGRGKWPAITIDAAALDAAPNQPPRNTGPLKAVSSTLAALASETFNNPVDRTKTVAAVNASVARAGLLREGRRANPPVIAGDGTPVRSVSRYRQWKAARDHAYALATAQAASEAQADAVVKAYEAAIANGPEWLKIRKDSIVNWLPTVEALYTNEALRTLARVARKNLDKEYADRCQKNAADGRGHPQRQHAVMAVLDDLIRRYGNCNGLVFPTRETIANATGRGIRTVDAALTWLETHGFIKKTRRRTRQIIDGIAVEHQTSNAYELILPQGAARRVGVKLPPTEALTRPAPIRCGGQSAVTAHLKEHPTHINSYPDEKVPAATIPIPF